MSEKRLRVVLVDDHAMVRAGVRTELGDTVDVVGEAAAPSCASAPRATRNPQTTYRLVSASEAT